MLTITDVLGAFYFSTILLIVGLTLLILSFICSIGNLPFTNEYVKEKWRKLVKNRIAPIWSIFILTLFCIFTFLFEALEKPFLGTVCLIVGVVQAIKVIKNMSEIN
jgi:mannitol-specific phosphotransferase system IIBC component